MLPAYKAAYMEEAIASILNQTYTDFELIIVNDASQEGLDSIVSKFDDRRIRYYKNESNIGGEDLVAQWNHSISYAEGDYLILASDDDVYSPEYLETFVPLIEKYPQVNLFRPRIQYIDAMGKITSVDGYLAEWVSSVDFIYAKMVKVSIASGIPYYIFNRQELLKIGGFINFPTAWFSDEATVMAMSANGVATSSKVLFSFRNSGINISSKKNDRKLLRKKVDAIRQFGEWFGCFQSSIASANLSEISQLEGIRYSIGSVIRANVRYIVRDSRFVDIIREIPNLVGKGDLTYSDFVVFLIRKLLKRI